MCKLACTGRLPLPPEGAPPTTAVPELRVWGALARAPTLRPESQRMLGYNEIDRRWISLLRTPRGRCDWRMRRLMSLVVGFAFAIVGAGAVKGVSVTQLHASPHS